MRGVHSDGTGVSERFHCRLGRLRRLSDCDLCVAIMTWSGKGHGFHPQHSFQSLIQAEG